MKDYDLPMMVYDSVARHVRDLVLVCCEIKTETSETLLVIQDGRCAWLPITEVNQIEHQSERRDGGYNGFVVIPRKLAEKEHLDFAG